MAPQWVGSMTINCIFELNKKGVVITYQIISPNTDDKVLIKTSTFSVII